MLPLEFEWDEVESVEMLEEEECYDICLLEDDVHLNEPNFIFDGFLVHNSGLHDIYCDRSSEKVTYDIHPLLEPILKDTYGVLCIHEDTLVSKIDGTEAMIKNIKKGDNVLSVSLDSLKIENDICDGCAPTRKCDGLRITLENGYSVTVTPDHKLLTDNGMKEAQELKLNLIAFKSENVVEYSKIKLIEKVENQQFYGMSVRKNHNLFGNGIVIKNCYQEQIMQVANVVGQIPIRDCYSLIKAVSKKDIAVFGKYKDMFIENGQKTLGWSEQEMIDYWGQLESFAGYAFNKSHAVAYTYLSSRLLYLKAHYPLEFFAGLLECETKEEKIHEYKNDAFQFNVSVVPMDINKSKEVATIHDDKIYIGISNVKGIGVESAKNIANLQPYESYYDFLSRFGTDSNANKPFISMRVFKDAEPDILYKYYEYFRDISTARDNRKKRNMKRREDLNAQIDASSDPKEIAQLQKKLRKCIEGYEAKVEKDTPLTLEYFIENILPTDETYIEEELLEQFADVDKALATHYGFQWSSPIVKSPDFVGGQSFEDLRAKGDGPVELLVKSLRRKTSQKGTTYYQIQAQDENEEERWVTIWKNDFERWEEEIKVDNLIRMRIKLPSNGFNTYTMESYPRNFRISKEEDYRIQVMKKRIVEIEKPLTETEIVDSVKEDFGIEL